MAASAPVRLCAPASATLKSCVHGGSQAQTRPGPTVLVGWPHTAVSRDHLGGPFGWSQSWSQMWTRPHSHTALSLRPALLMISSPGPVFLLGLASVPASLPGALDGTVPTRSNHSWFSQSPPGLGTLQASGDPHPASPEHSGPGLLPGRVEARPRPCPQEAAQADF